MYGISIGSVMRKNTKCPGTPSSFAASNGCVGRLRSPASSKIMMNGVYTQTSTSTTVNIAVEGAEAHLKSVTPNSEITQLSTPKPGLVISFHISAAIAGAVISGSSNATEAALFSRERSRSSSAMPRPSNSSMPTVETVYTIET